VKKEPDGTRGLVRARIHLALLDRLLLTLMIVEPISCSRQAADARK
jgi:hypothetical protein